MFVHCGDAVLTANGSLVLEALRDIGYYTEAPNPDFTYAWRQTVTPTAAPRQTAAPRRYAAHDLVVKGLWFTADVTTNMRTLATRLQDTVARVPHPFSPSRSTPSRRSTSGGRTASRRSTPTSPSSSSACRRTRS